MNPRTLAALRASIEHWERHAAGTPKPGETIYGHDCALCSLFVGHGKVMCQGCPVAEKMEVGGCCGTPYYRAKDAWLRAANSHESVEFRKCAQEEVDFLKSLLPADAAQSQT